MSTLVSDLMTMMVHAVEEQLPLGAALDAMRGREVRHLCVVNEGRLAGIVSDRDVKRALPSALAGAGEWDYREILEATPVSRVMTRQPMCVSPDTHLYDAVTIMLELKVSALPVVKDGRLVGIVTETDCLRHLAAFLTGHADALAPHKAAGATVRRRRHA